MEKIVEKNYIYFLKKKKKINPLNQFIMHPNHTKVTMFCLCMRSHEGLKLLTLSIMTEYSFACVTNSFYFTHIYYVMQIKWKLVVLRLIYLLLICVGDYILFAFYNFLAMSFSICRLLVLSTLD